MVKRNGWSFGIAVCEALSLNPNQVVSVTLQLEAAMATATVVIIPEGALEAVIRTYRLNPELISEGVGVPAGSVAELGHLDGVRVLDEVTAAAWLAENSVPHDMEVASG